VSVHESQPTGPKRSGNPAEGKGSAKSPVDVPQSCQPVFMNLLLIEDDDAIAEPLQTGLERQGFVVRREATGLAGLEALNGLFHPEIVLLDLGLPDIDGYEVCRRIRVSSSVPIIVVTARGDEIDRVLGLELGADDYLVKPFGFRELVARIRAVTRRTSGRDETADSPIRIANGFTVDPRSRRVMLDGKELALTRKEFDLLALLATEAGAIHTREEILEQVWDAHWYGPTKTLDVHIASLRRKLGDPTLIETVRGVGFRLRSASNPITGDAKPDPTDTGGGS
jgi:two-component system response regulator RegX3